MAQSPNLTRDQARERSATIATAAYEVTIDLTDGAGGPSEKNYPTEAVITFTATRGASTFLDFVGEALTSATLNGRALDVSGWSSSTGLVLDDLAADNELRVSGVGLYTNTGEGLHRFVDPVDGAVYLYSQFETADAKRLYPCFDQPDLKARFTFTVTAPADWQVISNGATVSTEPAPGGGTRHAFATTEPMSTYVTALVAGPYHVVRDHHDGIDLGLFCRSTLAEHLDAERLFTQTKQGFDFYHQAFGVRYPFGKYDQLFVPEFNAGAMENAGAVTFREEYVFRSRVTRYLYERRCETVLHEMAHMWFGDLVTMRWWDDLWLNESFATWASVVAQVSATEYSSAWTTFANVEKSWAYVQDQLPSTHPIAADMVDLAAVEVNFDGITYAKGASVLKQLAAYVGFEEFLAGLRDYFAAHAFGNATLTDLLDALERTSGRDLRTWAQAWLQTTGLNTISADFDVERVDGHEVFTRFELVQSGAEPGAGERRPHRLAVGLYDRDEAGRLSRVHRVELDVTGERTPVPDLVGRACGALVLVNDDDLTYCKARLDPASLETAIAAIGQVAESLPRTLLWSAVWEMTRDALMRARDFIALASRGLVTEDQVGVLQRVLMQLQVAVGSYAEPGWAAATGWPSVTATLRELAGSAPAGSDTQLSAVQALCSARLDDALLAEIAGWRDGSAPLPGLTVDTDLSWTLLGALVAHGAAGVAEIEAAEQADPTASGQRKATQVRALIPTAQNKAAVWDRLIHDDTMANALQDAAIAGFTHPAQTHLLQPFVEPYFQVVGQVWERRSSEVAQKVAVGLFPRWAIEQSTVDQALAWAEHDHPTALKRLVSEGRSGVERALRARAADAS
ncbi:aminopeptidase N [Nakamurella multipartita]|uniref:Aminopeptidase N n=1 Tax=Nakamurella multipartita (strain ATCC 700099 / DSM 44233 / CIP 104796 / JCM 9543 / NBRC 105858 / Y-104) TaxID=479431 RepID=C8XGN5_NAKMY|nr:aminopeptidase N [Nakamurella multipartita]ACV78218.1 aminopeptidase N [Nakamurella multipartita DSM 44233]